MLKNLLMFLFLSLSLIACRNANNVSKDNLFSNSEISGIWAMTDTSKMHKFLETDGVNYDYALMFDAKSSEIKVQFIDSDKTYGLKTKKNSENNYTVYNGDKARDFYFEKYDDITKEGKVYAWHFTDSEPINSKNPGACDGYKTTSQTLNEEILSLKKQFEIDSNEPQNFEPVKGK